MATNERIMLFIPAYRCERQITRVLAQLTLDVSSRFTEVVVIDNHSPDGTVKAAMRGLEKIEGCSTTLLQNDQNYNLGGSHKVAFNRCLDKGYDYVVVLHGDDQGSIRDLLPQLDNGVYRTCDSMLGARFARGSRLEGYSVFRTWGNYALNAMVSLVVGKWITDLGSGLNMFSVEFLQSRFYMSLPNDLPFNNFVLCYLLWKKASIRFFPLSWRENDQISNAKVFRQAFRILQLTGLYIVDPSKVAGAPNNQFARMAYSSTVLYSRDAAGSLG